MAEQQDQRYDIARAQLSPRERRDLDRDAARAEREGTYGTNIPKSEDRRARAQMMKDAAIAYEMDQAGESIPKDGLNELGKPVSTLGMSENDKFFAIGRAEDKQALKGYQSYGDKYLGEARNAVREITGRAPIANTPDEFGRLLDKSVAFGGDSSLLTPEGRTRAMKQGVGAGLSYQEADAAVQGAFDFLSKKYGKKDTTPPEPYGPPKSLANPTTTSTTATSNAPADIVVPETKTPRSPLMEFIAGEDDQAGGSALRGTVRGTKAADTIYDALKGKVGEAKNIVEEFNKSGGKLVDQGSLMSAADEATKGAADAAAKIKAFEDKYAGNAPKAGSPAEKSAVNKYNQLVENLDAAKAAEESATKAATEAAKTASTAAKAEKVAGGIGGKIVSAGEALGKLAAPLAPLAKPLAPVARIAGKVAGPAMEIYDAGKYFFGGENAEENQKIKDQYAESVGTMGQRLFGADSSAMERLGALGDVLSPTKNVLGTYETLKQWSDSAQGARESAANLKTAESTADAVISARRQQYSDDEFKALPQKDRSKVMLDIRRRIRKE